MRTRRPNDDFRFSRNITDILMVSRSTQSVVSIFWLSRYLSVVVDGSDWRCNQRIEHSFFLYSLVFWRSSRLPGISMSNGKFDTNTNLNWGNNFLLLEKWIHFIHNFYFFFYNYKCFLSGGSFESLCILHRQKANKCKTREW